MAIATSQFTIIDYNDALSLTGFITSNKAQTQVYNPDNGTYSPDWTVSPYMVLTPSLFKMGDSSDLITNANIQSIKWFDSSAPTTELTNGTTYGLGAFTAGQNRPLTIKQNVMTGNTLAKDYIVEIVYRDPSTAMNLTYKTSVSLTKVTNGGGITNAVVFAPDGNIFKNSGGGTLKAKAEMWRGNVVDTTSVTYQWYKKNPAVVTDEGGGIGWDKLDATTNYGTTGYTTAELTIPNTAVQNIETFKCIITDTDASSNTNGQKFTATIVFVDQTDPVQIEIMSTGGDVFKNGQGSTTLVARCFQAGTEVDGYGGTISATAPTSPTTNQQWYDTSTNSFKKWNGTSWGADTVTFSKTYKWYQYDKDNNLNANFGGTGISYKTGKFLAVGNADVNTKATFSIEID